MIFTLTLMHSTSRSRHREALHKLRNLMPTFCYRSLPWMLLVLVPQAFATPEDATDQVLKAVTFLSKTSAINDVFRLEVALSSSLEEVDRKSPTTSPEMLTAFSKYDVGLRPLRPGTGVKWLSASRRDGGRANVLLRFESDVCVSPTGLEEALNSKARFQAPPPMHGAPVQVSPGAFLPGTDWLIRVVHESSNIEPTVGVGVSRGVVIHFRVPATQPVCIAQLNLEYADSLIISPRTK
jgi:hypothetical protein